MEIKKYVAANMQEAIVKIKEELGPNALIIASRKIRHGKGLFGLLGKEMIEVSASATGGQFATSSFSAKEQATAKSSADRYQDSYGEPDSYPPYNQGTDNIKSLRENVVAPLKVELDEVREVMGDIHDLARGFRSDEQNISHLRHDINELKSLVTNYMEGGGGIPIKNLHRNLASVYQQLTLNGIEDKFAKRLIEESMFKIQPQNIDNLHYVRLFIARMIMPLVKTNDMLDDASKTSGRICFVGPTGVGKTTTLAKVAGLIREMDEKAKIGIISFDNFRVGSIEQLKEFSRVIKAKFRSAETPSDFKRQYKELTDMDYVLIDSFGTSQRDNEKITLLREFLDEHSTIEKLLVLNSSTKDVDITEQTKRFGILKLAGAVFTKLDEASTFGSIVNHMIRFKIPIYFLATGQKVPDDVEIATKERVIDLVLKFSTEETS